jgi:hypothetical protein
MRTKNNQNSWPRFETPKNVKVYFRLNKNIDCSQVTTQRRENGQRTTNGN